jgi:hypothetical protein
MKQQLAELIEAYAAARVSGNLMLIEYAAGNLNTFLAGLNLEQIKDKDTEEEK